MIGGPYALVAVGVVVVGALGYGAFEHQRYLRVSAEFESHKSEAERQVAEARAQAAEVRERVVVQYRDRIREIRTEPKEVIREIEVIKAGPCELPPGFRWLHDSATGSQAPEAGSSADPSTPVSCAAAIETIRENYARSRENSAQLKALQEWAASVSQ